MTDARMPQPDAILEPGPDVVFRDLGGGAVILHLATATYLGLNEVGPLAEVSAHDLPGRLEAVLQDPA